MLLQPRGSEPESEETTKNVRTALAEDNRYVQVRNRLGDLLTDDAFVDLYPKHELPAVQPWRLAMITVMQFVENLTDLQAVEAIRMRIGWKYVLNLDALDVLELSEFRQRLLNHEVGQRLLEKIIEQFRSVGLINAYDRERSDSMRVLTAVRDLNCLGMLHETLCHALSELAIEAPAWVEGWAPRDWFDRYGEPSRYRPLPETENERQEWAASVGQDGLSLLKHVYQAETLPWLARLPAVERLRQVWVQNYYVVNGTLRLRGPTEILASALSTTASSHPDAPYSSQPTTIGIEKPLQPTIAHESIIPHLQRSARFTRIALIYLALIASAELVTSFIDTRLGLALFGGTLVFLLFHSAMNWDKPVYEMLACLAIVPLIRLLPPSLPLTGLPLPDRQLIVNVFVLVSALVVARTLHFPLRSIGINLDHLLIQIPIGATGLVIGILQFTILELAPITANRTVGEWSLVWGIVLLSTAFVEELVFRGLLQRSASDGLGRLGGSVYVAALYAILQLTPNSWPNVVLVFGVALFYAWIVARTHSIVGVIASHGLANIVLLMLTVLVIPIGS